LDSFDQYTAHPKQGAPYWALGEFKCFTTRLGKRLVDNCGELALVYYIPPKRSGHSFITLGDQSAVIMYGGYSTVCADYCNDFWHLDTKTRIWTFLNMSDAPSPRFVSDAEYVERYGLGAKSLPPKYSPAPSRRWLHSMAAINETSVALFGGYWSQNKVFYFMNDLWIYTVKFRLTPDSQIRFADNIGLWHEVDRSNWGNYSSTVPPGRRGHISAFINGDDPS